jgi:hypothetical protein
VGWCIMFAFPFLFFIITWLPFIGFNHQVYFPLFRQWSNVCWLRSFYESIRQIYS